MSEFRRRLQAHLARLDGTRARRIIVFGAMGLFLSLLLGPRAIRAVGALANPVALTVRSLGGAPVQNPVRLEATGDNIVFSSVEFLVTPAGGTTFTVPSSKTSRTNDPSTWTSAGLTLDPGRTYGVTARGVVSGVSGILQSGNTVSFTTAAPMIDADGSSTTATDAGAATATGAQIVSAGLASPDGDGIDVSGLSSGIASPSVVFHVEAGATFGQDFPATLGSGGLWRGSFRVPAGNTYFIRMVVTGSDGAAIESPSRQVSVPPAVNQLQPSAPAVAPVLEYLFPASGAAQSSPIGLAADVRDATAVGVMFEIRDDSGAVQNIPASQSSDGAPWTALFSGSPGRYDVSVRASLDSGFVQEFPEHRMFTLVDASGSGTASPNAAPPTQGGTSASSPAPTVDLIAPIDQAAAFNGAVPLNASVKDGLPDRVAFVIDAQDGAETLVIATASSAGDFWTGLFDGADGAYRIRARASFGATDVFSEERTFMVERPAAPASSAAPR